MFSVETIANDEVIIKQTGIDADLSGLEGLDGVTVTGTSVYKVYVVTHRIVSDGEWAIDARKEMLVNDYHTGIRSWDNRKYVYGNGKVVHLKSTSILNLGVKEVSNGNTMVSHNVGIIITSMASGWNTSDSQLYTETGSTIKWYGNAIITHGNNYINSNVDFYDAYLQAGESNGSSNTNTNFNNTCVFSGSGLTVWGSGIKLKQAPPLPGLRLLNTNHGMGQYQQSTSDFLEVFNFTSEGNEKDIGLYFGAGTKIVNSSTGGNLVVRGSYNKVGKNDSNRGVVEIKQRVQFKFYDDKGSAAKVTPLIIDVDNGNRQNLNNWSNIPRYQSVDYTPSIIYATPSDIDGNSEYEILVAFKGREGGSDDKLTYIEEDYRCKGIIDTGVFDKELDGNLLETENKLDVHVWSYLHEYKSLEIVAASATDLLFAEKLFLDGSIIEQDEVVVAAYTTIENADMLRDYAKYLKTQKENLVIPLRDKPIIDVDGNKLIIPAGYSLTRDQSIVSAMEVDSISKKIKVKTGDLGLTKTDYSVLVGAVDGSFAGHTDMLYGGNAITFTGASTDAIVNIYESDKATLIKNLGTARVYTYENASGIITVQVIDGSDELWRSVVLKEGYDNTISLKVGEIETMDKDRLDSIYTAIHTIPVATKENMQEEFTKLHNEFN